MRPPTSGAMFGQKLSCTRNSKASSPLTRQLTSGAKFGLKLSRTRNSEASSPLTGQPTSGAKFGRRLSCTRNSKASSPLCASRPLVQSLVNDIFQNAPKPKKYSKRVTFKRILVSNLVADFFRILEKEILRASREKEIPFYWMVGNSMN